MNAEQWHDLGHSVWLEGQPDDGPEPLYYRVEAVCACGHDFMEGSSEIDFDYLAELIAEHRAAIAYGSTSEDGAT